MGDLARMVKEALGLSAHPRRIERALGTPEKGAWAGGVTGLIGPEAATEPNGTRRKSKDPYPEA